jgi:serine protease Do
VLSPPNSALGKVLSQYVRVRVTRMDEIDVGLFERDWNTTLYYFLLNADEHIYLRYGGRDPESPDAYLNLESLALAAGQGLELHRQYSKGGMKPAPRPKPLFPRQIPQLVERTFARRQCVECHLIGDFQNQQREREGTLDKLTHLYRSPDIKTLGIVLDVPRGLAVKEARGPAAAAGMAPGDRITALDGTRVWTFGDFQYVYDKVDRKARQIEVEVERGGKAPLLRIALPPRWWWTDVGYRLSSVEPRTYFEDRPLTAEEKRAHKLRPEGFASRVEYVPGVARMKMIVSHDLEAGDIVFAVDGVEADPLANTADLYIKLHRSPGDVVTLGVVRKGERLRMRLTTHRLDFRK